jgi:hypothetical protein
MCWQVIADKAAEKESAALKAGADRASKDARMQMEERRKKREQEAAEREASIKAAEDARLKKEARSRRRPRRRLPRRRPLSGRRRRWR